MIAVVGLVALTLAVYIPAMRAGLIWDDEALIFDNRVIRAGDGLFDIWFSTKMQDYWPMTTSMFWLEWRLWGTNPAGYHVVNVVLHALSAVLIWRVLRRLAVPGAFVAATLFAVHPVSVESVAWISERKNTLSMLLFVLSTLAYLRSEDSGRWRWYATSLLTFLLSLLAKTSVVMMPVVLLVLSYWRRGRITKTNLLRVVPFFGVSLALGLVTVYYQHHMAVGTTEVRPEGFFSRLAASGWCLWFYLYKVLLPVKLVMVYPRWEVDPMWLPAWGPLLGLIAAASMAYGYRRAWGRSVLVALAYFVAMLLPALGFLKMAFHQHSLVADHFQYVALIGPVALVVAAAAVLLRRWAAGAWAGKVAAVVVITVLSVLTWQQTSFYENEQTIWVDTLKKNPNATVAHNNLGVALLGQGKLKEAISHFHRVLQVEPRHVKANNNLGVALLGQGEFDDAVTHFRQVLEAKPDLPDVHNSMGKALIGQGNLDEAIRHYRRAIHLDPDFAGAHNNLGNALARQGQFGEAIAHFLKAIRLQPDNAGACYSLGMALTEMGDWDATIVAYRMAVEIAPNFTAAHYNLAIALSHKGDLEAAVDEYRQTIALDPKNAAAHCALACAYALQGHAATAVASLKTAIELDASYRDWAKTNSLFDGIRDDPAFRQLVYAK